MIYEGCHVWQEKTKYIVDGAGAFTVIILLAYFAMSVSVCCYICLRFCVWVMVRLCIVSESKTVTIILPVVVGMTLTCDFYDFLQIGKFCAGW